MEHQTSTEKKEYPVRAVKLPLEYWETGEPCSGGGLARAVSEDELLLDCGRDIHMGAELNVNVFFYDGYEVNNFEAVGKVIWKDLLSYQKMEGFQYRLEYTRVSDQNRRKILDLLRSVS